MEEAVAVSSAPRLRVDKSIMENFKKPLNIDSKNRLKSSRDAPSDKSRSESLNSIKTDGDSTNSRKRRRSKERGTSGGDARESRVDNGFSKRRSRSRDRIRKTNGRESGNDRNGKNNGRSPDKKSGKIKGEEDPEEGETGKDVVIKKAEPLSLEEILAKRKAEEEAQAKPKFLTKEERAAEALKRRQEEVSWGFENGGLLLRRLSFVRKASVNIFWWFADDVMLRF